MFFKYLKLILFSIVLLQVSAKAFDSSSNAQEAIQKDCKKKWGTDYEMVKYCIKSQVTAYRNVKRQSNSIITNTTSNSIITNNCKNKWGTNYDMIEYCIKNQTSAYSNVKNKGNGSITQQCKKKWGTNYDMIEYCIKNEETENPHINNKSSFSDGAFTEERYRVEQLDSNRFGFGYGSVKSRATKKSTTPTSIEEKQCLYYIKVARNYYGMAYRFHKAKNIEEKNKFLNFAVRDLKKAKVLCNKKGASKEAIETINSLLPEVQAHLQK